MAKEGKKRWRVVIVDDHPVIREGIRMCLKDSAEVELVGEAVNGREALKLIKKLAPDVVLLDLVMPRMGGLEALPGIRKAAPKARVIVFTYHNTREHVRESMEARVNGYLLKDSPPAEYTKAIQSVMRGRFFISPAAAKHVARKGSKGRSRFGLAPREYEYLKLAARGNRPKQIAQNMGLRTVTVRSFRKVVLQKLGLENMAALARFGVEKGI